MISVCLGLVEWNRSLLLDRVRRVAAGEMTRLDGSWLDHDYLVPGYVTDALNELLASGLVTLTDPTTRNVFPAALTTREARASSNYAKQLWDCSLPGAQFCTPRCYLPDLVGLLLLRSACRHAARWASCSSRTRRAREPIGSGRGSTECVQAGGAGGVGSALEQVSSGGGMATRVGDIACLQLGGGEINKHENPRPACSGWKVVERGSQLGLGCGVVCSLEPRVPGRGSQLRRTVVGLRGRLLRGGFRPREGVVGTAVIT